ncbi:hypothetical protein DL771_006327 [Monosporascus sp. 5C6A]|nr:hypothetical protein DL771_006327 [Monosporascus sp. 5C6A]
MSDPSERSQQVALMGNIYKSADRVVVLGPASDDSGAARCFVERMGRMIADDWDAATARSSNASNVAAHML